MEKRWFYVRVAIAIPLLLLIATFAIVIAVGVLRDFTTTPNAEILLIIAGFLTYFGIVVGSILLFPTHRYLQTLTHVEPTSDEFYRTSVRYFFLRARILCIAGFFLLVMTPIGIVILQVGYGRLVTVLLDILPVASLIGWFWLSYRRERKIKAFLGKLDRADPNDRPSILLMLAGLYPGDPVGKLILEKCVVVPASN